MKIELPMKILDKSSPEPSDDATLRHLLDPEETAVFTYKPYTFDIRDVGTFGMEDEDHTKIVLPFGLFYAQIAYSTFKSIYEVSLGIEIKTIQDNFKLVKKNK